uniref:DUF7365 family protein n=1 Tax=Nosocomiicoccus ampullae TaxID=489910 RepID=UPI00082DE50A|nr:hypothetical protein [Nosocomiicoccus ampullae]
MTELETQKDVLYWFVIVIIPILIGVFGLYYKQTKDKERAENRLTKIETRQEHGHNRIDKLEVEHASMCDEIKIIRRIEAQNEHIMKLLDEMRNDLKRS